MRSVAWWTRRTLLVGLVWITASLTATGLRAESPPPTGPAHSLPPSPTESDPELVRRLTPLLARHQVPGLVAGLVESDRLTVAAAVGLRKAGAAERIELSDRLHLGSDTKAMTATLLALLVEQGELSWDSTLEAVFPEFRQQMHAAYRPVTLRQLLQHRAGLHPNGPYHKFNAGPVNEQRAALTRSVLAEAPLHPPGSRYAYSNLSYIIAGHMAEKVTGKTWEDLLTRRVFTPLEMKSAGFGAPGTPGQVDQPWGHALQLGLVRRAVQGDNPAVLGPAGTVHCSLSDWSRFVVVHLQGARGANPLLTQESMEFLHTPPDGSDYAGGWLVANRPWAKGRTLTHSGSNTMWYCTVWIAPEIDAAFLAVTNQGGSAGQSVCDAAITEMIQWRAERR